jgi:putative two-component system response regulator
MAKFAIETQSAETLEYVRRMAILAEYHDKEVKHHIERIRGYTEIIAHGLNLPYEEVEIMSVASMLHDIGKISIPVGLQVKVDKFDPFEWEIIMKHPVIGADILHDSDSPYLQTGELIALTHHERWDGSGYPGSLREQDIPLGGRICAVADVFDALTTPRPYRKEIPVNDALGLIQKSAGTLFDPDVAKSFHRFFGDVLNIRRLNT